MARIAAVRFAFSSFLLAAVATCTGVAQARSAPNAAFHETRTTVAVAQLPGHGKQTYELIRQGGPFPYDKDGTVFGNRERLLPAAARGWYREYTVRTPAARGRGAHRIVCGGPATTPVACYYTADHYASFSKIVE
ncbi:MAG TPA: ribonuclease domain-containing protein [Rubrivivax sp.]|nr:ribonuclease domain-containing protein [Rubrivivax sp.]